MSESSPDRWPERYEPLPGLLGLPAFMWARTSRPARVALVTAAAMVAAGIVAAVPLISRGKHERALRARLRSDQAPRRGRANVAMAALPLPARRRVLISDVEQAITADARERIRRGLLPRPQVRETRCQANAPELAVRPAQRRGGELFKCLAASTVSVSRGQPIVIGFEFVAAINYRHSTFTWCKTNPPPGEGFGGGALASVPMSPACFDPSR